jgi:septal ring factor EnvC (AmiA/AmiB activator)
LLYDSLLSSAKSLVHRDDLVLKNEAEITRIRYEIELQALELHQKKEIVAEMQNDLEREKARYKALKVEIRRLEKRAEQLQIILKQKEDELE